MAYQRELLIKIAKLHHYEGKTHQEIADTLKISRVSVTRMLQAASAQGIVQITIADDDGDGSNSLEQRMTAKYGLSKVILTRNDSTNTGMRNVALAKAAAKYVNLAVQDGDVLGLGWGTSINGMIEQMRAVKKKNSVVVPVIGGVNEKETIYRVNEFAQIVAEKMSCRHYSLYAPAVMYKKETRDAIMSDNAISSVCNYWSQLDVLVVGIGNLRGKMPETVTQYLQQKPIDFDKSGVYGEICYNFFDRNGDEVVTTMDECLIRISRDEIQKCPLTIAVAWGDAKLQPMMAALKSGMINVLITHEETATRIME